MTGSGYGAFEVATVVFIDSANGKTNLGRALTNGSGSLSLSVTIPANATAGMQIVRVRGGTSGLIDDASLMVT